MPLPYPRDFRDDADLGPGERPNDHRTVLIYSISVSVDGCFADCDGAFGWTAPSGELFAFHLAHVRELGAQFTDVWSALPKIVFGRPLGSVQGNSPLAKSSVADEVAVVLTATGKDLEIGGATLAAVAIELGLIEARTFGSRVIYERYRRVQVDVG